MADARRSLIYWIILSPLVVINLFPFAVMISTSLTPGDEVLSGDPRWIPSHFAWVNFKDMWQTVGFGEALTNSLVVGVLTTVLTILVSVPAAYAMVRLTFKGKSTFQTFLLVTQMFSPVVLVIGLFRLVVGIGALDSLIALSVLYCCFHIAFAVWMLRSYFASIPVELEHAAWLEGASPFHAIRTVFVPMAAPAVAVTALFTFIGAWNEYALALAILRSSEHYTLPLKIAALSSGRYQIEWHHVMAATFVATIPVAILFMWLQRHMITGLSGGAVKG
ncbi:carbohydrate ABC transporter permease [Martelella alba]|uniref:Carbohydrate ABC transporter permease n=1 Tax=Martelella alba TaxID=2590451 RepID=A0A506U6Q2_9HYPH|nr:carbohydrate ABC transporter permease [Martelella alba]TPW30072.1 carbohydrate ABC transporter permease [Martelella alba]